MPYCEKNNQLKLRYKISVLIYDNQLRIEFIMINIHITEYYDRIL